MGMCPLFPCQVASFSIVRLGRVVTCVCVAEVEEVVITSQQCDVLYTKILPIQLIIELFINWIGVWVHGWNKSMYIMWVSRSKAQQWIVRLAHLIYPPGWVSWSWTCVRYDWWTKVHLIITWPMLQSHPSFMFLIHSNGTANSLIRHCSMSTTTLLIYWAIFKEKIIA
jgi:hypothetical protein